MGLRGEALILQIGVGVRDDHSRRPAAFRARSFQQAALSDPLRGRLARYTQRPVRRAGYVPAALARPAICPSKDAYDLSLYGGCLAKYAIMNLVITTVPELILVAGCLQSGLFSETSGGSCAASA